MIIVLLLIQQKSELISHAISDLHFFDNRQSLRYIWIVKKRTDIQAYLR